MLLALAGPEPEIGPEIGGNYGYSAAGLPWHNPCGPTQPSIVTRAYLHRRYEPREMQIRDREMGWSYTVRVSLPDEAGGLLDCPEVMDVRYFVLSGFLPYNPPLELPLQITGSLYAAMFHRALNVQRAEPVEREGTTAAEVMIHVPRAVREDLTVHHQGVALVYDIYGSLTAILTSNAVSVDVPGRGGGGDGR